MEVRRKQLKRKSWIKLSMVSKMIFVFVKNMDRYVYDKRYQLNRRYQYDKPSEREYQYNPERIQPIEPQRQPPQRAFTFEEVMKLRLGKPVRVY